MTEKEKNEALDDLTIVKNSLREIEKFSASLTLMIEAVKEIVDDSEVHAYLNLMGNICDKLEGATDDCRLPNKRDYLVRLIRDIKVEKEIVNA